jgi:hypothetical protein
MENTVDVKACFTKIEEDTHRGDTLSHWMNALAHRRAVPSENHGRRPRSSSVRMCYVWMNSPNMKELDMLYVDLLVVSWLERLLTVTDA